MLIVMNILNSKRSVLISSGVFTGTIFGALVSNTDIAILHFFATTFICVMLTMFIVRRLEIVKAPKVTHVLIGLTLLFILLFVPVARYVILGSFGTYDWFLLVPLLFMALLSFLYALILSLFIK